MERRLRDNAFGVQAKKAGDIRFVPSAESRGPLRGRELSGYSSRTSALNVSPAGDFGPCLYFGPGGERCSRRALEGGFCALHRRNAPKSLDEPEEKTGFGPVLTPKRLGALIAAAAALWPFVADLVREILRHLR